MPDLNHRYDLVVIGSGPGGYSAAIRASQRKLRVAVVEKGRPGGTCLNRGCIPTKALLHDAILVSKIKDLPYLSGSFDVSFRGIMQRKDEVVDKSVNGFEALLLNQGVELIRGDAVLSSPKRVKVNAPDGTETTLSAENIILATGTLPQYPSETPVDGEAILGTEEALRLSELPGRVAIIGSDYRGIEFATIFQRLGSEVTLIEGDKKILPTEDLEVSSRLKQVLAAGVKVMTKTDVTGAERRPDGLALSVETGKGQETVLVDKAIVMGERTAGIEGLGLHRLGLSLKKGFLPVGRDFSTTVGGVYAVGDMIGGLLYAHKALGEGVSAVESILGNGQGMSAPVARVIFSDPQLGAVGLTQREAEDTFGRDEVIVGKFPVEVSGRAMTLAESKGMVKVVAGKKHGEILGIHIIAPQATELIAAACLAMKNELTIHELRDSLFAHPTLSEAFHEAVLNIWGESIHFYS